MNGFLIIGKPQGKMSFDVVAEVRRRTGVKKVGHLGTLDPLATGVLVVAVGQGTKLIEYLMGADKVYEATIELGKVSDTYDSEGTVEVSDLNPSITREQVEAILPDFIGEVDQIPPIFSALKVQGKRAYELARKGEVVELKSRKIQIHSIDLLEFDSPLVKLRVHCGSGTYIRSLAHDLGQELGCGAILTALRRTSVGSFNIGEVSDELIPLEVVVQNWPRIALSQEQYYKLKLGQRFPILSVFPAKADSFPVVAFYEDRLVSLVEKTSDGFVRVLKNIVVN